MSIDAPRLREDLLAHAGFLRALARATLRGDSECEDLEQDVWRAALAGAPIEPARQRPWLVVVLKRRAADLLRGRYRQDPRDAARAIEDVHPSVVESVERAETGRRLVNALLALEEPFRTAVLLRFQDGLPPREVATRTGVPVETARSRIRRGLERLRVSLDASESRDGRNARAMLLGIDGDARPQTPPSIALAGGWLVTKNAVVSLGVVLGLVGAAFLWFREEPAVPESDAVPVARAADDAPELAAPGLRPAPAPVGPAMAVEAAPLVAAAKGKGNESPTIRGRVVGDDGSPIVGALLRTGHYLFDFESDAVLFGSARSGEGVVTTDAQGRFELLGDPRWGGGQYVQPQASGWCVPAAMSSGGTLLFADTDATIRMKRGVTFVVRVVDDATGNSIAGADVGVFRSPGFVLYTSRPDVTDSTDATGTARLTVEGGDLRVVASALGYATREGEAQNVGASGGAATIRLGRGGTLDVTVVDGDAHPIAGAQVAVLRASAARLVGLTDARGLTRIEHVPVVEPGPEFFVGRRLAIVAARAEGFARIWTTVEPAKDGQTAATTIVLTKPRTLTGRVHRRDGTGVADVVILAATTRGRREWGWESTGGGPDAKSGVDGGFELIGVNPGTVHVSMVLRVDGSRTSEVKEVLTLEVPAVGEIAPLDLVLDRPVGNPAPIRVRVLDFEGRGVGGAQVRAIAVNADLIGLSDSTRPTMADGTVELGTEDAGPWWLTVDAAGAGPIVRRIEVNDVASGTIDVRPASGVIEGRAARLDGSPARVKLSLTCALKIKNALMTVAGYRSAVETDAQGRFRFKGVGAWVDGIHSVTPSLTVLPDASRLIRADATDLRVIVIDEAEAAGLRIDVDVLDATSRSALSGMSSVDVSRDFAKGYGSAFLAPGSTSLHRTWGILEPGAWRIRVSAAGYETQESVVTVTAGKAAPRVTVLLEKSR